MVASVYFVGAMMSGSVWMSAFLSDKTTPNTHGASWMIVAIATLIWPLAIPLAMAELLSKKDSPNSGTTQPKTTEKQYT